MNQIPHFDCLPERTRWNDTARSGLPVLCLQYHFAQVKRIYGTFLSQSLFRDSKKVFCDFSVGREVENDKTETRHHFFI